MQSASTTATRSAACPECAASIPLEADAMAGEILPCPECLAELELVAVDPPALELAPEVEEDWGE